MSRSATIITPRVPTIVRRDVILALKVHVIIRRGKTQKRVSLGTDKQKQSFRRIILKPFVGLAMLLGHLSPDVTARKDSPSDWS